MSIPLIDKDFNKAISTKNNLSKSTESKPGLAQEEVMNIINKALSNIEDNKQRIFRNITPAPSTLRRLNDDVSNSDTSDSNSGNSSTPGSEIEVIHKTEAVRKRPIRKRKVKGRVNYWVT